jgi:hypothetical protein
MKTESRPLCSLVSRKCRFQDFIRHTEQLNIQAKGSVLIIGPASSAEEIALIEQQAANHSIKNITAITVGPLIETQLKLSEEFRKLYPKIPLTTHPETSCETFFENNPDVSFNTIIFIGTHETVLNSQRMALITSKLKTNGKFYATINGNPPESRVKDPNVSIITNIQTNPNYPYPPGYYGLIVQKIDNLTPPIYT